MSRYLNIPVTGIVDQGFKVPTELWYNELAYKRKKQAESDATMDELAKVNFVNDPKDQEAADKVRQEIRSTIDEITPLYLKDPAAATNRLKQIKRDIERRTSNTGEDIYTFTSAVATKQAQQEALGKLGKDKDAVDEWVFMTNPYNQWTGSSIDPATGKWSTNMKFPSVTDIGDPYKALNDRINQMPDRVNYGNPQFISVKDPTTGEMVTVLSQESTTGKGLQDIKNAAIDEIYTNPERRREVQLHSAYTLAHASDEMIAEMLNHYTSKRDNEINNLNKTIDNPKTKPDIKEAALQKKAQLEQQINELTPEEAAFEYQADNMVKTAKDLYGKTGYKVEWSNVHRAEKEGNDPTLYKDIGQIAGGANLTTAGIKQVKEDLTNQGTKIEDYNNTIDNLAKTQASKLSLDNDRLGPGTGLTGLPTANDKAIDGLKQITPYINQILEMPISLEEQQALVESNIEYVRTQVGALTLDANTPFKFAGDEASGYSFDEFIKDHEVLAQNLDNLQQAQIIKDRNDLAVQSLYSAAIDKKDFLSLAKLDYDSAPLVVEVGEMELAEPTTKVRQGILLDYFGVRDAKDYNQLLIELSSQSSPEDIYKYQKELADPRNDVRIAKPIEFDSNGVIKDKEVFWTIQGLSQRLKNLDSKVQEEVKKDPELQKSMITNRILTPSSAGPTKDPVQLWSDNLVKSAWADTYRIGTLKTPTGEQLWEQVKREQKNNDIREATLIPSTFQARPVVNPTGPEPAIEISFSTKTTQVPPTTIIVSEDQDNAVYKSLHELADNMISSGNPNAPGFVGHLTFGKDFFKVKSGLVPPKEGESFPVVLGDYDGTLISVSIDDNGKYQIYAGWNPPKGTPGHSIYHQVNDDKQSTAFITKANGKSYHDRPNSIAGLFEFLGNQIIENKQDASNPDEP